MLATIPEHFAALPASGVAPSAPANAATRAGRSVGSLAAGGLWRAVGEPGADFAWVVAIIGTAPDAQDRLIVAPVFGAPAVATDHDFLLDATVLGYPAFADVANTGTLLDSQLTEPVGELSKSATELLQTLYRAVLSDGPPPESGAVGVPVTSADDPRLLDADERRDALRRLWRAADRLVDLEGDDGQDEIEETREAGAQHALPDLLARYLEGPAAEWDRESLLERSGADSAVFDAFCNNKLDLTDQRDLADLARVISTLQIPWEQAEPAITTTLWASRGGMRRASQSAQLPLAARGASGATEKAISAALNARHSHIDDSDPARTQQVAAYVAELRKALDDLD